MVAALALVSGQVQAGTIGDLTSAGTTFGTVTLTQQDANTVDVNVALLTGVQFVTTGKHAAFAFNLDTSLLQKTSTVDIVTNGFTYANSDFSQSGYGTFTNEFFCTGCGKGSSAPKIFGPLEFSITNPSKISVEDFTSNSNGYYFSADLYPVFGKTSPVGSSAVTSSGGGTTGSPVGVPEPSGLLILGAALAMLRSVRRRG